MVGDWSSKKLLLLGVPFAGTFGYPVDSFQMDSYGSLNLGISRIYRLVSLLRRP